MLDLVRLNHALYKFGHFLVLAKVMLVSRGYRQQHLASLEPERAHKATKSLDIRLLEKLANVSLSRQTVWQLFWLIF